MTQSHFKCLSFDCASIHMTGDALQVIHELNNGNHYKIPVHYHHVSPVQKGFSNVWRLVRQNWSTAEKNQIQTLNNVVQNYSVSGPCSSVANLNEHFQTL